MVLGDIAPTILKLIRRSPNQNINDQKAIDINNYARPLLWLIRRSAV